MRIENIITSLKNSQTALMESVFQNPPQNFESFKERLGMWQGLNEAIRTVTQLYSKDNQEN